MIISGNKKEVMKLLHLMAEHETFEKINSIYGLSDKQLGIKPFDSINKKYNTKNVSIEDFKK